MKHFLATSLLVMVIVLGAAAYLGLAGTAIIYSLGANGAARPRRIFFGILGLAMLYAFICGAIYLTNYGCLL